MTLSKAATHAALYAASSGLVLGSLAGCAGNEVVPTATIQQAEERIDEANRAEAQRYANRELNMAREELAAAREALEEGDEEQAARLAERAELDAVYATAVADNQEVQVAVAELRETLDTLQSELERQQAGSLDTQQQQNGLQSSPPIGSELGPQGELGQESEFQIEQQSGLPSAD